MFLLRKLFCSRPRQSEKTEVLDVAFFKEAITKKNAQLVDLRTLSEFTKGHIEGAIHIDFFKKSAFEESFEKLNKDLPVYIYCRSGGRSRAATGKLVKMGFSKIYDLKGGILAWKRVL